MAGRTCGTCGAPVPVLADQCPACGADPDFRLVEVGALDLGGLRRGRRARRAATGGANDDEPGTPGGPWSGGADRGVGTAGVAPPPRRLGPVLAIAAVLLTVVVVLATAPGEEPEGEEPAAAATTTTSTTRPPRERDERPPRSTTTSTTRPPGPLLGAATGLLLTSSHNPRLIDLDTGEVIFLRGAEVLAGSGGRLLVANRGDLAWWPAPYDGTGAELLAEDLAVDQAWVDADGTTWVIQWTPDGPTAIAFGPAGGRRDVPLGDFTGPMGVAGGRLIVGQPGGTFAVSVDGRAERISTGNVLAAGGDAVFVSLCDESLACRVEVLDPDGDVVGSLPPDSSSYGGWGPGLASSRGELAQLRYDDTGTTTVVVGDRVVEDRTTEVNGGVGWSPDGRWLFLGGDGVVFAYDVDGGGRYEIEIDRELDTWPLLVVSR